MLKPVNPNLPRNETAPREVTPRAQVEPRTHGASGGPGVTRLYDKPKDPPDDRPEPSQPNRAYAQAVRGQIQRVRLDLLARENERLDRQIQQLIEQQKEQSEKDRLWRQHWETRSEQEREQLAKEQRLREQEQRQREHDLQMLEQERRLREQEQMQHARQLQKFAQERQLHDQERQERKRLEARLQELGAQVDRLNSDLARQAVAVAAAKQESGVRETVKPLLLAVIEMLGDSDPTSVDAATALLKAHGTDRARTGSPNDAEALLHGVAARAVQPSTEPSAPARLMQNGRKPDTTGPSPGPAPSSRAVTPGNSPTGPLATAATARGSAAGSETKTPPAPSKPIPTGSPAAAKPAPLPEVEPGVTAKPGPSAVSPDNAKPLPTGAKPEALPESLDEDLSSMSEKSSLDDEVAIEIARLLRPQDSEQDGGSPPRNPEPDEKLEPGEATSRAKAEEAPLLLGTSQTPALDVAPVTPPGPPKTAAPKTPVPSQLAKAAASRSDEPDKPEAPQPLAAKSASAPPAEAREAVSAEDIEREPLPKCLTERWDDHESSAVAGASDPLEALRRDKSSFRWPFRRLRSAMEHDQAMEAAIKNKSRTPSGTASRGPATSKRTAEK